jgi:Tol biopolymer transport system component
VFSAWLWLTPAPAGPLVKFQITAPGDSRLPLGTPVLSPDGRSIAYVVDTPKRPSILHVRNLESTESTPVPGTERAVYAFWSPDSRSLAFWNQNRLRRVDLA